MSNSSKSLLSLGSAKRRFIQSSADVVTTAPFDNAAGLPFMVRSSLESLKLHTWIGENLTSVENLLLKHGAILFRGFDIAGQEDFGSFTSAIRLKLTKYMEGATPRRALGNDIYTSTEFPPEHAIALHNENSYVMTWPMKICFCCLVAPQDRGETPIADVRRVLKRIAPEVLRPFEEKGYMLIRNFSEHLALPWQNSFGVSTREELESYCRQSRIEMEWLGPDRLRTRQVRPAVATHPVTGEPVWFNHAAFWHVSSLEKSVREALLAGGVPEDLPYNTYYGDGTPIEDEVVAHIRQCYDAETVKFPWQRGDLLLLDNMLVAHGRSAFAGPRKIVVALGDPYTRTDCQ